MLESRPTHLKLVVALCIYLESGAETTDVQDDLQEGCQVGPGLGPTPSPVSVLSAPSTFHVDPVVPRRHKGIMHLRFYTSRNLMLKLTLIPALGRQR